MGAGGAVTTSRPRVQLKPTQRVKLLNVYEQWSRINSKLDDDRLARIVQHLFEGCPIATVCDLVGISMDTWSRWKKWGEDYLKTGKPTDHEMHGKFVVETRAAVARWKHKVITRSLDTESYKPSWARDMTMLERRDRDNWGSGNTRGQVQESDPDMKFL
jgi:hypothetical protein